MGETINTGEAGGDLAATEHSIKSKSSERHTEPSRTGGLAGWLDEHEYASVKQMEGSLNQTASPDPRHFYARRDPIPWD